MRALTIDDTLFDDLASRSAEDLISIFIPTHPAGREISQDPIRLKNQLATADDELAGRGHRPRARAERLERANDILEDRDFWEHQGSGLAVYIDTEGEMIPIGLSHNVPQLAFVMQVFEIRPLIADLSSNDHPVLVLTRGGVRLYRFGLEGAIAEDVDLPDSFDDVNWFVDREPQLQQHPNRAGVARGWHGHESPAREGEDITRFLRAVALALPPEMSSGPLVVLGDDDVVERFAHVYDGETVSPAHSGVPDPDSSQLVADVAAAAVAQIEESARDKLRSDLLDEMGVGRATTNLEQALPDAVAGRVGRVAVRHEAGPVWGRFDEFSFDVRKTGEPGPGDVDLLDRLVVEARKTGADLYSLDDDIEGSPFVATYRF